MIQIVEGYLLTPVLTGRASGMNAVAIFASVLGWGWLWGVWGVFCIAKTESQADSIVAELKNSGLRAKDIFKRRDAENISSSGEATPPRA